MKKQIYIIVVFVCLFACAPAFASSAVDSNYKNLAIHTYGGGELFKNVFNAISMFLYGNSSTGLGKTFNGIIRIALTLGGFSVICLCFAREKLEPLLKNFFLPALLVINLLLVPRSSVTIQDHLVQVSATTKLAATQKVDNVPFFLAIIASLGSTLSYVTTNELEKVAHNPDNKIYNWTGHIYAGENLFQARKSKSMNREVEDNFREFCRECVWRDIGIGLYSREDLAHQKNILEFLEDKTSNIRSVSYTKNYQGKRTKTFLPCNEAIKEIRANLTPKTGFGKAIDQISQTKTTINNQAGTIINGELQGDISFLLDQSAKGERNLRELIQQQKSIDILKDELPGTLGSFAARKAEMQQRESQKILGFLSASSVVAMKNFFEAVAYMIFPFIVIVSLISFGVKPLLSWLQYIIWVNIWPPFFVIVNFLLNSVWNLKKSLSVGADSGLTIYSSDALVDLYDSMEAMAASALVSIAFLSWILIKGGVSQMVHLASSMQAPTQTAAATAASESTTGNFSFGNTSLGNASAHNYDAYRQNVTGHLSRDQVSVDQGSQSMNYALGNEKTYLKQNDSSLRESVSQSHAFNQSVQDQLHQSESVMKESSEGYTHSVSETANQAAALMEAYSSNSQHGNQLSMQESSGAHQTFQQMDNLVKDYSQSNRVSYDRAVRDMYKAGCDTKFFGGVMASADESSSKSQAAGGSEGTSHGENFVDLLQQASSYSQSEVGSFMSSQDIKKHEDFSRSFNDTISSAEQFRVAHSQNENLSQLKNFSQSDNLSVHESLNQQYVDYLGKKYEGDMGMVGSVVELPSNNPSKKETISEFISSHTQNGFSRPDLSSSYTNLKEELHSQYLHPQETKTSQVVSDKLNDFHIDRNVKEKVGNLENSRPAANVSDKKNYMMEQAQVLKKDVSTKEQRSIKKTYKDNSSLSQVARQVDKNFLDPVATKLANMTVNLKQKKASKTFESMNKWAQGQVTHREEE